jgi:hypothetical protein
MAKQDAIAANLSSEDLPADYPYEIVLGMARIGGKSAKRSDGYDFKIVVTPCVSFDGKAFGRCGPVFLGSGRLKS